MSIYRWITKIEKKENTSIKKEGFTEQNENKRCFSPFIFRYKKEEELTGHKQMRPFHMKLIEEKITRKLLTMGVYRFQKILFLA